MQLHVHLWKSWLTLVLTFFCRRTSSCFLNISRNPTLSFSCSHEERDKLRSFPSQQPHCSAPFPCYFVLRGKTIRSSYYWRLEEVQFLLKTYAFRLTSLLDLAVTHNCTMIFATVGRLCYVIRNIKTVFDCTWSMTTKWYSPLTDYITLKDKPRKNLCERNSNVCILCV